jgi:predicted DNA-binding protein (MmcQ/YjbR family)
MKQEIINFIDKKYNAAPEYLWRRYPTYCIFRHNDNRKWFAIIMSVPRKIIKLSGDGNIDIINVKCSTDDIGFLLDIPGILPAYHMSKANWISVVLDGTVPQKNVKQLIKTSFELTEKKHVLL